MRFRQRHISFRRGRFFRGLPTAESDIKDITWLRRDGTERLPVHWADPRDRCLIFLVSGEAYGYHVTPEGEPESDDTFLVVLNAETEPTSITLPPPAFGRSWQTILDSAGAGFEPSGKRYAAADAIPLEPRSVLILIDRGEESAER